MSEFNIQTVNLNVSCDFRQGCEAVRGGCRVSLEGSDIPVHDIAAYIVPQEVSIGKMFPDAREMLQICDASEKAFLEHWYIVINRRFVTEMTIHGIVHTDFGAGGVPEPPGARRYFSMDSNPNCFCLLSGLIRQARRSINQEFDPFMNNCSNYARAVFRGVNVNLGTNDAQRWQEACNFAIRNKQLIQKLFTAKYGPLMQLYHQNRDFLGAICEHVGFSVWSWVKTDSG